MRKFFLLCLILALVAGCATSTVNLNAGFGPCATKESCKKAVALPQTGGALPLR